MIEFIASISPQLTAGILSIVGTVIAWKLNQNSVAQKARDDKMSAALERIEKNTQKLQDHETLMLSLADITKELKEASESNGNGVKVIMRYMLQRYHAEYKLRGFISSHEKDEFLEAWEVYAAKHGNGTGEGWKNEVCALPVRDDLPIVNPYLAILKSQNSDSMTIPKMDLEDLIHEERH